MPRVARNEKISKYYHIMVQGINREYIFENPEFKKQYISFFKNKKKNIGIRLIAYCVMDNHVHMLVFSDFIEELSKTMSSVNTKYAIYYNKKMDRCGYVFRDRFKSEIIIDRKHLENCIKYIHNNPVKANICKIPSEYNYSSYKDFLNKKIDNDIIYLLCDGLIENSNRLLGKEEEGTFIDIDDKLEFEKPQNVLKEYNNFEYLNKEGIYIIIRDLKKRCNISNKEIADLLNIKRSSFYNILKEYGSGKV